MEKSVVGRALSRPDQVRAVWKYARTNGLSAAYRKVQSKLDTLVPLGYSAAGTVVATGNSVTEFGVGDRVACAGGGYATHSEYITVPQNLAVRCPAEVPLEAASLVAIGAIAMHGVRQAQISLGETVAVIGAGLVGSITIQLVKAAGCRVIAIDSDAARAELAGLRGADLAIPIDDPHILAKAQQFSEYGVDAAVITAASQSAGPVELAAKLSRDRGKIVIVGDVGMGVSRALIYEKELSIFSCRSYGPGRYDPTYEELGVDYPIGYVRWTERRNMRAFLEMIRNKVIDINFLFENCSPIEEAPAALSDLKDRKQFSCIIKYESNGKLETARDELRREPRRVTTLQGKLGVGCIGAGGFASESVFPALRDSDQIEMVSVGAARGASAESARRSHGFQLAETPTEVIDNPTAKAIFILTRHESHARFVVSALKHGKMVFVEKPLAIDREQIEQIKQAYTEQERSGLNPFLMVGFNRRFAPYTEKIKQFFAGRREPMVIQVRINAGLLARDHWVHRPEEGGRLVGEVCHFVDWVRFVIGAQIVQVSGVVLRDCAKYHGDNAGALLRFRDGSLASIFYLANGDFSIEKEYIEVFCEGGVARLTDFTALDLVRDGKTLRSSSRRDKGHARQFKATLEAMRRGDPSPIPFEELIEVTESTLSFQESLRGEEFLESVATATASAARHL
jgi:predicted dehydrogenase/threonine dehydrogenase-like Zn-dependent dehydrogenase